MEIEGSKTEKNLMTAFAGESQARNRYTFFAAKAKKEGYVQISRIFTETATQEGAHAKALFRMLKGGSVEITASFPAGVIADTVTNLKESAAGEKFEWNEMYPSFAVTAREEGFDRIADLFEAIAVAEKMHGDRYSELAKNIDNGRVFKKEEPVVWVCAKCGYIHEGVEALKICPACSHPQAHFEVMAKNW